MMLPTKPRQENPPESSLVTQREPPRPPRLDLRESRVIQPSNPQKLQSLTLHTKLNQRIHEQHPLPLRQKTNNAVLGKNPNNPMLEHILIIKIHTTKTNVLNNAIHPKTHDGRTSTPTTSTTPSAISQIILKQIHPRIPSLILSLVDNKLFRFMLHLTHLPSPRPCRASGSQQATHVRAAKPQKKNQKKGLQETARGQREDGERRKTWQSPNKHDDAPARLVGCGALADPHNASNCEQCGKGGKPYDTNLRRADGTIRL